MLPKLEHMFISPTTMLTKYGYQVYGDESYDPNEHILLFTTAPNINTIVDILNTRGIPYELCEIHIGENTESLLSDRHDIEALSSDTIVSICLTYNELV